jgi:putative nucleotidyltransferase with HDIG domain
MMKDELVMSLIYTLELYDDYTGGHSEEVAFLAREIGKRMGIREKDYNELFWAGIIHDIGKVGIPNEILNKESKLTYDEYEQIKKHPTMGYDILSRSSELKNIALMVKYHHEWYNGAGYPEGLSKEEIPLGSRVIAVCDAVSSMIKKRVYSKAKSIEEIRHELIMYKELQFDPKVVDKMVQYIDSGELAMFYKNR